MEIKKAKKADLEGQKSTSLLIGYIITLATIFVAFEWTTREYKETEPVIYAASVPYEEEIIPITQPIFQTAAPPPPVEVPQVAEIIDIVENDEEIEEEEIQSTEDTQEAITGPTGPVVSGPVGPVMAAEEGDEGEVFQVVEQMPEFPGGMDKLMEYLSKNIKYPSIAQENNIQGRVIVEFVVNKDGSIVEPKVMRSVDTSLDNEAMRVIKSMPKWNPGKQRGKAVRVRYTVPVLFRLQ
ncbi:MAG: TonB family protein [Bacteroidaceae bacterium]|jgi:protein TonB|nr:TonB family protein [Bacteroidaceae bacterium]